MISIIGFRTRALGHVVLKLGWNRRLNVCMSTVKGPLLIATKFFKQILTRYLFRTEQIIDNVFRRCATNFFVFVAIISGFLKVDYQS